MESERDNQMEQETVSLKMPEKKKHSKAFIVMLIIVGVIGSLLIWGFIIGRVIGGVGKSLTINKVYSTGSIAKQTVHLNDTIDVIYVQGVIGGASSMFEEAAYNHQWTLNEIDSLINDESNKAIMLYVNSPGGGVYESDELYLKLKEYKEVTGRPVYAYMAQTAASGGYYICMAADKIYANRMTMTGSIGVIMSTMDTTELEQKIGVKTEKITSGKNKAMGNPLTEEQRQILQSMIDETYGIFVNIVAENRNLPLEEVKKIADGRVYSALQAKELHLIDEVGLYEEALADLKANYDLEACEVNDVVRETTLFEELFRSASQTAGLSNELVTIKEFLGAKQSGKLMYYYE